MSAHTLAASAPEALKTDTSPPWHTRTVAQIQAELQVRPEGLTTAEAAARLQRFGPNTLPPPPRKHPLFRFLAQFNNALIYFLLVSAAVAALVSHLVDAAVIAVVVVINAIVGFLQEGKAERALEAIRAMIAPNATVLRDGVRQAIDVTHIVPGDVVLLEPGDRVPADLRLIRARSLQIDEAILTGESVPAEKSTDPVALDAALGDRVGMAFSGALVATGQGAGVVVATGEQTQIGHISTLIGRVESLTTPLLQQINRFGRLFTVMVFVVGLVLFALATLFYGYSWVDALMVVVALAVGAIPEGLPAVITITLAIGVQRMANRQAIVRRLPAVETLGAISVICSDKTGTLTKNEMTVRRLVVDGRVLTVEGTGYAPLGGIAGGESPLLHPLLEACALCNDARLVEDGPLWRVEGDPMEGALLAVAMKGGLHVENCRASWARRDEIPFDAQHRFMAVLVTAPDGAAWVFVKGAPERVLDMCSHQQGLTGQAPLTPEIWTQAIADAASAGERVLGFAALRLSDPLDRLTFATVDRDLCFLGLAGFIDPPREEAVRAVAACRSAGIAVKMITGDHAETAIAIARQIGIAENPQALTGADLDRIADADLAAIIARTSVFARTSPEHKLRLVRALQQAGGIVAMTGDGVNDAPSLKQADVGIAMGRKGTEAAKQAAQMVLADDNFASIVAAVHEGRTVYDNIRKVIGWTLPTNGGEVLCVVVALLLGWSLPMTAAQILWINMLTSLTLGLVLAFEPPEAGVMGRPPRSRTAPLMSGFLLWRCLFVSLLFMVGVFAMTERAYARGLGEAVARTMAVNAIVVMEIFYLFNVRYLHTGSFNLRGLVGTWPVLGALLVVVPAQFALTYSPWLNSLFSTAPVPWLEGLATVGVGILLMLVLEVEKLIIRRLR